MSSTVISVDTSPALSIKIHLYKPNSDRIHELAAQRNDLTDKIAKLEAKIVDPRQIKLSKAEFLNLRVDNEKVASYLWEEPFASLVKATELSYGRGDRT